MNSLAGTRADSQPAEPVVDNGYGWQMGCAVAQVLAVLIIVIGVRVMMNPVTGAEMMVAYDAGSIHRGFQAAEQHDAHQQLERRRAHTCI